MLFFLFKIAFIAIFNAVFFLLTKANCIASVWVAFGFIHLAYLMILLSPLFVRKSAKSTHVFAESISFVIGAYFLLTFGTCLYFIFVPHVTILPVLITEIILTGLFFILLLLNIIFNNASAKNEDSLRGDKSFLNNVYVKIEFIKLKKANSSELISELNALQEEAKYSPVKSCLQATEVQNKIIFILDEITAKIETLSDSDILTKAAEVSSLIKLRNLTIKQNQ